jgi:hypothetical protein
MFKQTQIVLNNAIKNTRMTSVVELFSGPREFNEISKELTKSDAEIMLTEASLFISYIKPNSLRDKIMQEYRDRMSDVMDEFNISIHERHTQVANTLKSILEKNNVNIDAKKNTTLPDFDSAFYNPVTAEDMGVIEFE